MHIAHHMIIMKLCGVECCSIIGTAVLEVILYILGKIHQSCKCFSVFVQYKHMCIPAETLTPPGHRVYSVTPRSVSLQNRFQVESVSRGHFNTGGGFGQFSPNSNGHKSL